MAPRKPVKKKTDTVDDDVSEAIQFGDASHTKSLVFISHDSRDADLAEAFANLLADVSGGTLKSFRSSDKKGNSGIEFGTEWYKAIMSQLGNATDVVALLTHHSIDRPWILYEAGVAKGKLDTNVLGVALGVPLEKVSTGPFGQFQNCGDDEDSLTKLVIQLLQRNPDASPREQAVRRQVVAFLDGMKKLPSTANKPGKTSETDETGIAKLFEEVKAMVRELPGRVDDRVRSVGRRNSLAVMRRIEPMMLEELLHLTLDQTRRESAMAWLLFLSALKDDLPWLYEIGIGLFHALQGGNPVNISRSTNELISMLDVMRSGPFFHEVMRHDDKNVYLVVRRLPDMLESFLARLEVTSGPKRGRSSIAEDTPSDN